MNKIEERLREILGRLPDEQVQQLLEYAEFLLAKHGDENTPSEPLVIARPEVESVVAAIKRLRSTYPMLEPAKLLNETYDLMTQHVMQGRNAAEVIDELEVLFRRHYEQMLSNKS
ncbi:MAG: Crp/Fnr family transcriptional regulator [Gammaproteobacteria bacterium]|nr:Crp/Fnr family transcriptional regulator [Gammaproteobacteria bacterium]